MTYERFEDLPVWKDAIELGRAVYQFTDQRVFRGRYSLRDQIERAAVSVSNNISEGFERGTTQELITFLYYSRGLSRRGPIDALVDGGAQRIWPADQRNASD